jgi:hypothetical protein
MFPGRVAVKAAGRSRLTVALNGINTRQAKTGQGRVARAARLGYRRGNRECGTIFAVSDYARASDACFRFQAVTDASSSTHDACCCCLDRPRVMASWSRPFADITRPSSYSYPHRIGFSRMSCCDLGCDSWKAIQYAAGLRLVVTGARMSPTRRSVHAHTPSPLSFGILTALTFRRLTVSQSTTSLHHPILVSAIASASSFPSLSHAALITCSMQSCFSLLTRFADI